MKLRKWFSLITWKLTSGAKKSSEAATLGVMPDYGFSGTGMRLSSISSGKTAEKNGFRKGDIVVKIGKHIVEDLIGYMSAMQHYNVGDTVDVVTKREESKFIISVEFV